MPEILWEKLKERERERVVKIKSFSLNTQAIKVDPISFKALSNQAVTIYSVFNFCGPVTREQDCM